ncbi:MAG TPA: tRNA (adenosine(37)-N6)-threonylcarbamoyltransferase complex ATPase subunit type 1 TsaE [Saprospiraceae bacterium]|nr:tRNA (adenosine(37)-N6)-threonylcarbamoyltransferase complex ATPase subunit type 1 TsaE [Saprospiraceae bacterium]HMP13513.1 tRNA (adenosine(37)-N6)-threonylcarbamoyltransferase complex ATPase subunit type 1 TsaE [Saprospiraceae bacterium]
MTEFLITSASALPQIAAQLLGWAGTRRKMAFYGEIGAGKTTFIQAICAQLGVCEAVVSPTFALAHEYTFLNAVGQEQHLYHLDLYRLQQQQEALDIGIEDMLYDDEVYCFIEWPELIETLLPEDTVRIKIEVLNNSERKIVFL